MLEDYIKKLPTFARESEKRAYLYYLEIDYNGIFYYKIGVTVDLRNRLFKLMYVPDRERLSIAILDYIVLPLNRAYFYEDEIIGRNKEYRIHRRDFIVSTGNSEVFKKDVIGCDWGERYYFEYSDKGIKEEREKIPSKVNNRNVKK